ncbi:hypothetical protein CPT_Morttis_155 [Acinetobacter phage Morttis]|nr:hypothetical protein CPT_Morttis_155 [Acinetobacter phage Morttis]
MILVDLEVQALPVSTRFIRASIAYKNEVNRVAPENVVLNNSIECVGHCRDCQAR